MLKISILTVFPELHDQFLSSSLIARAQEKKLVEFNTIRLSDLCNPKERIDEPTCGPGTGMIIRPEVIEKAIEACEKKFGDGFKIFFSPQGIKLTQKVFQKFAEKPSEFVPVSLTNKKRDGAYTTHNKTSPDHLILICSRYEGIDARVEQHYADAVFSVGDYVLMGGDVPAQLFLEGFLRLIPGVVGKEESVMQESFSGSFLDYPEYGLPKIWKNLAVPEIVLSGNHATIEQWRKEEASKRTIIDRFDWFASSNPGKNDINSGKKQIPNHYAALMHTDIVLKGGRVGHSSVTSLDLHDIARSSATYGIKNMFMVSPLKDQKAIMNDLLDFWKSETGKEYNLSRFEAVSRVHPLSSLNETIEWIEKQEGKKPLIIATSAKIQKHIKKIDYFSQGQTWKHDRPILFLFGTGQGLSDALIEKSDFLLVPINGMTDYNHLSVRSAVAIILDRWLGLNPKNKFF